MNKVEAHRQKMMDLVEEWQKSGQSQKAFAQFIIVNKPRNRIKLLRWVYFYH